jgi:hypothetical protein
MLPERLGRRTCVSSDFRIFGGAPGKVQTPNLLIRSHELCLFQKPTGIDISFQSQLILC